MNIHHGTNRIASLVCAATVRVALLLLAMVTSVAAQTHPCDAVPTAVSVGGRGDLYLWFCVKDGDELERVDVRIDGMDPVADVDIDPEPQGPPNADGYVQYRAPFASDLPAGVHSVTVTAVNFDEFGNEQASEPSDPYTFTVLAPKPKPSKPKVTGVTR